MRYYSRHYKNILINQKGATESRGGSTAKVQKINRDIMRQILKEEHQKEMEELLKLQTEQNMQVFNDLQDIAHDTNKQAQLTFQQKTPPTKIILKNNFLRTYANSGNDKSERPSAIFDEKDSPDINISFRKISQPNRPYSEQLVFRTKQKKEQILPDVGKITNTLDTHKFGEFSTRNVIESPSSRSQAISKDTANNFYHNEKQIGDLRAQTAFSVPKLETPRVFLSGFASNNTSSNIKHEKTVSSVKNERNANTLPQGKPIKELISEEIEFLNRERAFEEVKKYAATHRIDRDSMSKNFNSLGTTDVFKTPTGTFSNLDNQMFFAKSTTSSRNFERIVEPRQRVKIVRGKQGDKNGGQFSDFNKKSVTSINPKPDFSVLRSLTRNSMMLKHGNMKHDFEITNSKGGREVNKPIRDQNNKKGAFSTKLISVNKDEPQLTQTSSNSLSYSRNQLLPIMQLDMAMNNQTPLGLMMKNGFGTKYWKNNFE